MNEFEKQEIRKNYQQKKIESVKKVDVDIQYYIHIKTGARLLFLLNSDENKSFYIAQRTLPKDNKGIPHIIEHTIMSSSSMLNDRNIYSELSRNTLCNYLNALTYSDKTLYAFSTVNEREYEAIIRILGDAIYNANILRTDKFFFQEGINFTKDDNGRQKISGVVYNEMLGSYGSENRVIRRLIFKSLYPDTSYRYDSGGNPIDIEKLSFEEVKDFYKKNYTPSNSYIYFYGNLNVNKYLKVVHEILSGMEKEEQQPLVLQRPFTKTKILLGEFPAKRRTSEKYKTVAFNYSIATALNKELYQAFDYIDYLLIKSAESEIKKFFIDNNICSTVTSLFETGIYQPFYSIIFYNVHGIEIEELKEKFDILLGKIIDKKFEREKISRLFKKTKFEMIERRSYIYPLGLHYGVTCLDSWIYDDDSPVSHLDWNDTYEKLKKEYENDYFERIIKKYILDNQHSSIIVLEDKKENIQNNVLKKEVVFQLPKKAVYNNISSCEERNEKIKLLHQNIKTNDIAYMNFIFDITDICSAESMPIYRLHSILLGSSETKQYSLAEIQSKIDEIHGGFRSTVRVYPQKEPTLENKITYEIEIKTLKSNIENAIQLVIDIMKNTNFSNIEQLKYMLECQSVNNSVMGERRINELIFKRCLSYCSSAGSAIEIMYGIEFYKWLNQNYNEYSNNVLWIQKKLRESSKKIFARNRLQVSIIGNEEIYEKCKNELNRVIEQIELNNIDDYTFIIKQSNNVHEAVIHDFKNCNIAMGGNVGRLSDSKYAYFEILKIILNYDYLFQKVRNEYGAYGVGFSFDYFGNVLFNSYNNNYLDRTIEIIRSTPYYIEQLNITEENFKNSKIGALKKYYTPTGPYETGRKTLENYFKGIDNKMVIEEQEYILSANLQNIRNLADEIGEVLIQNNIVISGNKELLQDSKEQFVICDCQNLFIKR